VMLPLLELAASRHELTIREAIDELAKHFALTDEEREELLRSGGQRRFDNRVSWARTYMKEAGLLEMTGRGRFRITEQGRAVLATSPERIDVAFVKQFPGFVDFLTQIEQRQRHRAASLKGRSRERECRCGRTRGSDRRGVRTPPRGARGREPRVPGPLLASIFRASRTRCSRGNGLRPLWEDAAQVVGRSGDGGIDGAIKQDPLGLDVVYAQAKRWTRQSVGRPVVQQFAGALLGCGASKGVFITTGEFTPDAREYARSNPNRIILIDGRELARLMVRHGPGSWWHPPRQLHLNTETVPARNRPCAATGRQTSDQYCVTPAVSRHAPRRRARRRALASRAASARESDRRLSPLPAARCLARACRRGEPRRLP